MAKDRSKSPIGPRTLADTMLMALPTSPAAGDEEPWQRTHVVKTLWPPQAGTVRLRGQYGASLVCVRYRHDASRCHRYTTVEIVVDHAPVKVHPKRRFVEVAVAADEQELRAAIQARGGRWDKGKKVWVLDRRLARGLGLGGTTRKQHVTK